MFRYDKDTAVEQIKPRKEQRHKKSRKERREHRHKDRQIVEQVDELELEEQDNLPEIERLPLVELSNVKERGDYTYQLLGRVREDLSATVTFLVRMGKPIPDHLYLKKRLDRFISAIESTGTVDHKKVDKYLSKITDEDCYLDGQRYGPEYLAVIMNRILEDGEYEMVSTN
ncbi:hypothetical protein DFQ30_000366 [Apophysomyces sp. BC1015]|nr:hypothetical protein DFQ30_000366 [Apophysomyces sp. BC1015]KAG0168264.1 hypothetical protein DFQ29_010219 [Apophysomyces sp. BC1021]